MDGLMLLLLHGDAMDIIYFWSSIVIVALPLTIFTVLTYWVVKASRKGEKGEGSGT